MNARELATDTITAAGLIAGVYAVPRTARPAVGLAAAVTLSRLHRRATDRVLVGWAQQLFDQRATITPRLDAVDERVARLERILSTQYGGKTLDEIERGIGAIGTHDARERLPVWDRVERRRGGRV